MMKYNCAFMKTDFHSSLVQLKINDDGLEESCNVNLFLVVYLVNHRLLF